MLRLEAGRGGAGDFVRLEHLEYGHQDKPGGGYVYAEVLRDSPAFVNDIDYAHRPGAVLKWVVVAEIFDEESRHAIQYEHKGKGLTGPRKERAGRGGFAAFLRPSPEAVEQQTANTASEGFVQLRRVNGQGAEPAFRNLIFLLLGQFRHRFGIPFAVIGCKAEVFISRQLEVWFRPISLGVGVNLAVEDKGVVGEADAPG